MRLNRQLIRDEMRRQGITLSGLAKKLGRSRQSIFYHKAQKPVTLKTVNFWAKALKISPKDLLVL